MVIRETGNFNISTKMGFQGISYISCRLLQKKMVISIFIKV